MQMTGQQSIPAPGQRVWEALCDPDILKRCIPGCQSLTKESEERMRATVDIKIGPIGARFNGTVTLSEMDPPKGCTLTIEGQGGTVGSVKSRALVRLNNDDTGGTLLSYDVDAQIGGRLAQLGGPLIDSTAKQLAGRFFKQFGSVVGAAPEGAIAGGQSGVGAAAGADGGGSVHGTPGQGAAAYGAATQGTSPHAAAGHGATAHAPSGHPLSGSLAGAYAPASRGAPVAWILALVVAALVGYLVGHAQHGAESDWMGLAIGLLLLVVGFAGFEFGRRAAAPVVTIDPALLARLIGESKR